MQPYGGFWIRFVAALLDGLILAVPITLVRVAIDPASLRPDAPPVSLWLGVQILAQWLYKAGMESSVQQATLGKMAVSLKVTDLDGRRISFARASGRYFATILSSLILFVGHIMIAFTQRKQGLHDMLASTLVYKKDHAPRPPVDLQGPAGYPPAP